ncbi:hypothetical protein FRC02_011031 [Tulasnella sp. 418]|nr:hypothetical protein FRC02_011031 [Tulasnella sp. 418]
MNSTSSLHKTPRTTIQLFPAPSFTLHFRKLNPKLPNVFQITEQTLLHFGILLSLSGFVRCLFPLPFKTHKHWAIRRSCPQRISEPIPHHHVNSMLSDSLPPTPTSLFHILRSSQLIPPSQLSTPSRAAILTPSHLVPSRAVPYVPPSLPANTFALGRLDLHSSTLHPIHHVLIHQEHRCLIQASLFPHQQQIAIKTVSRIWPKRRDVDVADEEKSSPSSPTRSTPGFRYELQRHASASSPEMIPSTKKRKLASMVKVDDYEVEHRHSARRESALNISSPLPQTPSISAFSFASCSDVQDFNPDVELCYLDGVEDTVK